MRHPLIFAMLGVCLCGGALAHASATPPRHAAAKPAGKRHGVKAAERTPISKACSAKADARQLHGKPRQKFRRACMKKK